MRKGIRVMAVLAALGLTAWIGVWIRSGLERLTAWIGVVGSLRARAPTPSTSTTMSQQP
jgi:hypothetical protein